VITDEKQIIKTLSRIRVSTKNAENQFNTISNVVQNESQDTNKSLKALNPIESINIPELNPNSYLEFKEMLSIISSHMNYFINNPKSRGNWYRVANKMKAKLFKTQYKPLKCKGLFFKYANNYVEVLIFFSLLTLNLI
jgi:hypothetical protein